ncbi:hypothetical protein WICPIJ_000807 [Wickerhamomyces pijperi]|uniref:alpha-1,2-Mannosidase n=1 Tax=Wickerhamomyces pijperi TaxID=599730 RepID=A0A9P8TS31_WICPI|nr:hypothetical protein WICPIJ_000807 [Wickerhamomyces pijperi]
MSISNNVGLSQNKFSFSGSPISNTAKSLWKPHSTKPILPLYKDKPFQKDDDKYHKSSSGRKRQMLVKASVGLFVFWVFYQIGMFLKSPAYGSNKNEWAKAKQEVRQIFKESWAHYEKDAWGMDVYKPLSHKGENMGPAPLGWMIVDSLDTMLIMGLDEEYKTAEAWVENELTYDMDYNVNVFETTIRMLGGLLSAFYLSKNDMYLEKAVDLGNRLIGGFDSATGLPFASVNLKTGKGVKSHADGGASSTAEVSTLQLEFKYLAKLTGESLYWEKVEKIMKVLDDNKPQDGLVPIFVNPNTGKYQGNLIRLGSRGDSYYEYLLKQYLQTQQTEPVYNLMYTEAVRGMKDHLLRYSKPSNLAFLGELEKGISGPLSNKMDHLVCFIGGLFALGATEGVTLSEARRSSAWSSLKEEDFTLGKEITHSCYQMYHQTETGLAPEIAVFNTNSDAGKDFIIKPADAHNLQRPETVESIYLLYKLTGDEIYREWGYEILQSFIKYTRTKDGAFTSLKDVTDATNLKFMDNMESFWLAETLKYLYLLFEDDESVLPLNDIVFNTEAHPLPRFEMGPLFKTGWKREPREYVGKSLI